MRPCALTEEPAGADLIFDQGDNITVLRKHFGLRALAKHSSDILIFQYNSILLLCHSFSNLMHNRVKYQEKRLLGYA